MAQSPTEWLEQHAQRLLVNQKSAVDTAKLLVTFVSGIAATLVATAMQVGVPSANTLDHQAAGFLAWCIGAAIAVILLDRLQAPNHTSILELRILHGWDDTQTLAEFCAAELSTVLFNRWIVAAVQVAVAAQVVLAVISGVFANRLPPQ